MSPIKIYKIILLIFLVFALGEIMFIVQRFGFPKIELFEPKPGTCKILEENFCSMGRFVDYNSPKGGKIRYIAFELKKGTPVFYPINGSIYGKVQVNQPSPFQGLLLSVGPSDRSSNYNFTGDLKTSDNVSVQAGKIMATIGNTNAKEFGQYNLVFTITKIDPTTKLPVTDEELLKKLFPSIK